MVAGDDDDDFLGEEGLGAHLGVFGRGVGDPQVDRPGGEGLLDGPAARLLDDQGDPGVVDPEPGHGAGDQPGAEGVGDADPDGPPADALQVGQGPLPRLDLAEGADGVGAKQLARRGQPNRPADAIE